VGGDVHVHIPVTITVAGTPSDADLAALETTLRKRIAVAITTAGARVGAQRQAPRQSAVAPSAPEHRAGPPAPGVDWRVLRALTVPVTVEGFLDAVLAVNDADTGGIPELTQRELIERLGGRERLATVWLVEVLRTMALDDLENVVTTRFLDLARADLAVYAISPTDRDRGVIAALDPGGAVGALPPLARVNARRVPDADHLLPGARALYSALPVPRIDPAEVVSTSPVTVATVTAADLALFIDIAAFEQRYLPWDLYSAELGMLPLRLALQAGVVHRPYSFDTATEVMLEQIGAQLTEQPGFERSWRRFRADDPDLPWFARRLLPGQQLVVAAYELPLDPETLTAARWRPDGKVQAAAIRARLAGDPTAHHWGWDFYWWLHDTYGTSSTTRSPGGNPFEYVALALDSTGDLTRLLDAALASGDEPLRYWLLQELEASVFAGDSRVLALRDALSAQHRADLDNTYYPASPDGPGALRLHDGSWLYAGIDQSAVLAKADGTYVVSAKRQRLKKDAADRLREAVPRVAIDLLKELSTGVSSQNYTPDSFGVEVFTRASAEIGLRESDVENYTVERSWRVEEVQSVQAHGIAAYRLVLRAVEREGDAPWQPVGDTFSLSDGDFEADLIYWVLGRMGEVYQTIGLAVTVIGVVVVAWEAGVIALLIEAGGGAAAVGISVVASEVLYFAKVLLGKAELTWEGFFLAAAEGYLMSVGFRSGALAAAPIGRLIGGQTVARLWTGIVLERLAGGAIGGGLSSVATTFVDDLVNAALHDGQLSGWRTYVRNLGIGAGLGALGELTMRPVLSGLGRVAAPTAKAIVAQLKTEGVSLATFSALGAGALSRLRQVVSGLVAQAEAGGLYDAFEEYLVKVIDEWGTTTVARRVLELQGIQLTAAAEEGVARLTYLSETPLEQEAVHRLTTRLITADAASVAFLEVLGRLDPAVVRRLLDGAFGSTEDVARLLAGMARYPEEQQRAMVALLTDADLVPPRTGGGNPADVLSRDLDLALEAEVKLAGGEPAPPPTGPPAPPPARPGGADGGAGGGRPPRLSGYTAEGVGDEFTYGPLPAPRDDLQVDTGPGTGRTEGQVLEDYADAMRDPEAGPATAAAREEGVGGAYVRENLYYDAAQRRVTRGLERGGIIRATADSVEVLDPDRYLAWLDRAYFHHGETLLDPRMAQAIRDYIGAGAPIRTIGVNPSSGGSSFAGSLPGTHAELQAVNDVLQSGAEGPINVATLRAKYGGHFAACLHCRGVLDILSRSVPELRVLTGVAGP
jgi:hypothetical protein